MRDAVGETQTIVVFGGTSEIGLATVTHLIGPATRSVVLACRDVAAGRAAADALAVPDGVDVSVEQWDATSTDDHGAVVDRIIDRVGDLDIVVMAAGVLGDQDHLEADPSAAASMVTANFTGPVVTLLACAQRLRAQGHGHLVVLSSVAGVRVRRAAAVYGATKSGLDQFAVALADGVAADGVEVTVVRPGFVHGRMTQGLPPAPFATTPDAVGAAVAAGVRRRARVVWAPGVLRYVFAVLAVLPRPVFRRIVDR